MSALERQVAAANEQIGVAKAAFYPALSFGGSAGSQAAAIADLLTTPTRLWSVGAQVAETLFDGGKRRAQVRLTQAAYALLFLQGFSTRRDPTPLSGRGVGLDAVRRRRGAAGSRCPITRAAAPGSRSTSRRPCSASAC